MKNRFSPARLGLYARAEITSNTRTLLLLLGSVIAFFAIIFYLNHLNMPTNITIMNDAGEWRVETGYIIAMPIGFCWAMIVVISIVNISTTFRNFFNKGYSSATMMLPVAKSEKFIYATVLNMIIVPALLILAASLLALAWSSGYDIEYRFFTGEPRAWFDGGLVGFAFLSIFLLGSVMFRRLQLLFTLISITGIGIVMALLSNWANKLGMWNWLHDALSDNTGFIHTIWQRSTLEIILSVFIVGMWLLSWNKFRKLQITK